MLRDTYVCLLTWKSPQHAEMFAPLPCHLSPTACTLQKVGVAQAVLGTALVAAAIPGMIPVFLSDLFKVSILGGGLAST
jgi:hypothetical protein